MKKTITFPNFYIKSGIVLMMLSIIANHLTAPENFPLHKSYQFPWFYVTISFLLGSSILLIIVLNFKHFRNFYFDKVINLKILLRFLFSTLGYISLLYIPVYYVLSKSVNRNAIIDLYYLLIGLLITLLISALGMVVLCSPDLYKLHKLTSTKGTLKVQQNGIITLINFVEISFIYSENKTVYIAKNNGVSVGTNFTLNDIENKLDKENFFRANRQIILHSRAIEQIQHIGNGRLSVSLKPVISGKKAFQISISRYKKRAFLEWCENKF